MKIVTYVCDFCGKEINKKNTFADIDFVITQTDPLIRIKSNDVCPECAYKISNFLESLYGTNRKEP